MKKIFESEIRIPVWYRSGYGGYSQRGALAAMVDLDYLKNHPPFFLRKVALEAGISLADVDDEILVVTLLVRAGERRELHRMETEKFPIFLN